MQTDIKHHTLAAIISFDPLEPTPNKMYLEKEWYPRIPSFTKTKHLITKTKPSIVDCFLFLEEIKIPSFLPLPNIPPQYRWEFHILSLLFGHKFSLSERFMVPAQFSSQYQRELRFRDDQKNPGKVRLWNTIWTTMYSILIIDQRMRNNGRYMIEYSVFVPQK